MVKCVFKKYAEVVNVINCNTSELNNVSSRGDLSIPALAIAQSFIRIVAL